MLDLPELRETNEPITVGDTPATGGSSGGSDNGGGGGDGPRPSGGAGGSCELGQTPCADGSCAEPEQPCSTGCDPARCQQVTAQNATAACHEDGTCQLSCDSGWVDCDGEPSNGCEADFSGASAEQLVAHQLPQSGLDWSGFPAYTIGERCRLCDYSDMLLEPISTISAPTGEDLSAVFNLGWTDDGLFLRLRLHDDSLVITDSDARLQDNVEVVYHGPPNETDGTDDQHLFVSFRGRANADTNKGLEFVHLVEPAPEPTAGGCVTMTLLLDGNFLSGARTPAEALIPTEGDVFVFNVAVNDVDAVPDTGDAAAGSVERQHQLFYKDPKSQYWHSSGEEKTANVGTVLLAGPPKADN